MPDPSPTAPWSTTLAFQESVPGVLGADGATGEGQPIGPDGSGAAPAGSASPFGSFFLPLILLMVVLMVFTTFSSGRRQKREKEALMKSLGKHDRVQTIGGVIGTIMEIDAESVVLRVDESTNTRIRFARSAVQQVLRGAGKGSQPDDADADKSAA